MNTPRVLLAVLLSSLFVACADPVPYEIVIENIDEETRYLRSSQEQPMIILQERVGGEWTGVWTSIQWMCSRRCGAPGGQVVCAMGAAELSRAYVLLPGESATVLRDGEAWVEDVDAFGSCARKTTLTGEVRIQMCHSREVEDGMGVMDVEPDSSGMLGSDGEESWPSDPICEDFEFTLEGTDQSVLLQLDE
jgi:hypothetical protein